MIPANLIRTIAVIVASAVLAGCDANSEPLGTPGSATIYLHGRTEVDIGASGR